MYSGGEFSPGPFGPRSGSIWTTGLGCNICYTFWHICYTRSLGNLLPESGNLLPASMLTEVTPTMGRRSGWVQEAKNRARDQCVAPRQ
jgi:hypothetical protein